MRFEFLEEHRGEIGPIRKACGLMEVSRSGFCEYLGRKKSDARIGREALEGFVVEAFGRHEGRYGCRRIDRELRKSGIAVSGKRVLRIMRKLGLAGKGATRKHRVQRRVEPGDPRLNPVERAFSVGGRNGLWVGDCLCQAGDEQSGTRNLSSLADGLVKRSPFRASAPRPCGGLAPRTR